MAISLTGRFRATRHSAATVQDEIVVLHLNEGVYYGLNASGATLWDALRTPRSLEDLIAALRQRFEVSDEQARVDVARLLEELIERGLVERLPD